MLKYFLSIVLLFFAVNTIVIAQQQPLYSQFSNNKYLFNPAVAGADIVTTVHVNAYEQWIGFKGAPKFHLASIDSKIFSKDHRPRRNIRKKFNLRKPQNVGLGAQLFTEKHGPLSHTGMVATYAYHMRLQDSRLSFGFSSVISNYGLKSSDIIHSDEVPDRLTEGDNTRRWITDFDFGVYLFGANYFSGYSVHHISESMLQWGGSADADYKIGRVHYLMGGYTFDISSSSFVQPTALIKIMEKQKSQFDINLKYQFLKDYWSGLAYKTSKNLSVFAGFQYDRYVLCYSFDYNLTPIRKYSYGSHEFHVAVRLGADVRQYKWLNRY